MPQARSGGSGSGGGSSRRSSSSSRSGSTGRSGGSRSTGRSSGGSKSSGSGRSTRSKSGTARSSASRSTRSTSSRSGRSTRSTGTTRRATAASGSAEARLEAISQRVRKLNERIIDAGRDAGETTLTSYERALKAIASTLEKGPGSSDINWVADLATAQAKFIRDLAASWTSAARKVLK